MSNLMNTTSYGADMLRYAGLKGEAESGPLFFALTYADTLRDLGEKIAFAVSKGDKVRSVVLDHWKATPEGEEFQRDYAGLVSIKLKTPDQQAKQDALLQLQNQVNTNAQRNVDTIRGIDMLRADNRQVNIQRIDGTKKYACYVVSMAKNADGTQKEFINVEFTATHLRKLASVDPVKLAGLTTADVRKLADSQKQGTPNDKKGGSEGLARTEIGKTAKALDAAIAGTFIDGKLQGVSPSTRREVMLLWAAIDLQASEVEKNAARDEFNALAAAKPEPAAEVVKVAKPAKAKAKAA